MADWVIEQGETEWFLHLTGQCGEVGPCRYCEPEKKSKKSKKPPKKEEP